MNAAAKASGITVDGIHDQTESRRGERPHAKKGQVQIEVAGYPHHPPQIRA